MAKKPAKSKSKSEGLEVPCSFKGVNFGDKIVSIGIGISRGNITPALADKTFTSKRLTVKLYAGVAKSAEGQTTAFADGDLEFEGVADVAGFNAKAKNITSSLAFMIESVDGPLLSKFAKRDGRIVVSKVDEVTGEDAFESEEQQPND